MRRRRVAIFDYGAGNVYSASQALDRLGVEAVLTSDADELLRADGALVPGVGAFQYVKDRFSDRGGERWFKSARAAGQPILGICVGMQLLFEFSLEDGRHAGLGALSGGVDQLRARTLPHIGWQRLDPPTGSQMFQGLSSEYFYFVHSYARLVTQDQVELLGSDVEPIVTLSNYGAPFVAAVEAPALWGTQFHPEKSGEPGLRLLRNWVSTFSV